MTDQEKYARLAGLRTMMQVYREMGFVEKYNKAKMEFNSLNYQLANS